MLWLNPSLVMIGRAYKVREQYLAAYAWVADAISVSGSSNQAMAMVGGSSIGLLFACHCLGPFLLTGLVSGYFAVSFSYVGCLRWHCTFVIQCQLY